MPGAEGILRALRLLLFPGRSLAARVDESFAEFLERLERGAKAGDRGLLLHKRFISAEYVIMLAGGVLSGYRGYALRAVTLLALLLPLLALIDVYASERAFRRLSWRPKYVTSLLWCSDMVYHFALGSAIGSAVAGLLA